ncbi:MAG TPA: hypothetical protein DCQ36_10850 [Actinobacteria bacterium]|nr:hypothetical protein [Actinomycetota bacterium]
MSSALHAMEEISGLPLMRPSPVDAADCGRCNATIVGQIGLLPVVSDWDTHRKPRCWTLP